MHPTSDTQRPTYWFEIGDQLPPAGQKWTDRTDLKTYKQAAAYAAAIIRNPERPLDQILASGFSVWSGSLEIVTVRFDRVTYDSELEPAEGKYIATAIQNAKHDRRQAESQAS